MCFRTTQQTNEIDIIFIQIRHIPKYITLRVYFTTPPFLYNVHFVYTRIVYGGNTKQKHCVTLLQFWLGS
jgi:hypothetical protein